MQIRNLLIACASIAEGLRAAANRNEEHWLVNMIRPNTGSVVETPEGKYRVDRELTSGLKRVFVRYEDLENPELQTKLQEDLELGDKPLVYVRSERADLGEPKKKNAYIHHSDEKTLSGHNIIGVHPMAEQYFHLAN